MIKKISFVIPVYNESPNIIPLVDELKPVADALATPYEIIFIDDGSSDDSLSLIQQLADKYQCIKYLAFDRNRSKSAALYAGFQYASGDPIVTLDADLQNDPNDIPRMLQLFGEYDVINGWRHKRQDTWNKRVGSKIGNGLRNKLTYERIQDTACCLKVLRADMAKQLKMFRGLHRFLPTLMRLEGAKVTEVKINDRPRLRGQSKYTNAKRAIDGFYDTIAVRWMIKRHLRLVYRENKSNTQ